MHNLSDLDRRLLMLLRENGREPVTGLAAKLDISRTTVQARMERLEDVGVVRGYTVRLAPEYEGRLIRAQIALNVVPKRGGLAEKALRGIPEVISLHCVSGTYDYIAIVATESIEQLDRVIDAIGALDVVERTTSSIILSTKFER